MSHTIDPSTRVGDAVAQQPQLADVFAAHQIDFCCGGGVSIAEAAERQGIAVTQLMSAIAKAATKDAGGEPTKAWPIGKLIVYILENHHAYIREKVPIMMQYLDKVVRVHGQRHPKLVQVRHLFLESAAALRAHLQEEETQLFPRILQYLGGESISPMEMRSLLNALRADHTAEGARFDTMAALTHQFTPPEDACATYRAAYLGLAAFQQNLHQHVHLENNILFERLESTIIS